MQKISLLFLATLFFLLPGAVHAATTDNLSGYAWSSTIGWVSLNCTNASTCGTSNYGVNVSSAGALSGHAWSSNTGWISFNSADLAGCPSGTCSATFNKSTGAVTGWARVISGSGASTLTGNWKGWISLSGATPAYGVTATDCNWGGYAWGGGPDVSSGVVGWLSFSGSGYGVLGTGNACSTAAGVPSGTFTAAPTAIVSGGSSTLTWSTSQTSSCTIDNAIGAVALSGSRAVTPSTTTTYTLTCVVLRPDGSPDTTGARLTRTAQVTVSASSLPDVTAGAITPTTATAGTSVTLSSTIANNGSASTGTSFTNNFQRATDASGTGATSIGTFVSGIPNGFPAGYSEPNAQVSYTFPSAGTFYVRACADNNASMAGTITEGNEANNCGAWTAVTVTSTTPDLTATTGAINTSVMNSAVTLTGTVTNIGAGAAGAFPNVVQVCNDPDCATINTNATLAGTSITSLAAGAGQTVSASYTPTSSTQLMYRICSNVNSSWTNIVTESNYGNNCSAWKALAVTSPTAGVDLTAGSVTPTAASANTATTLSSIVTNSGTVSTGATFNNIFQTATDAAGTGATVIGTVSSPIRAAGTSGAVNFSYTFPSAGTSYVRVCADNNASFVGTIAESNESNNCSAWTAVNVSAPSVSNLTAGSITPTSATTGTAVTLSATVTNSGTGSTGTTFSNIFQSATSAAGAGATVIGSYISPIRTAGTSGAATLSYTFPSAGTVYVRACADQNASFTGTITESNEGDNCSAWTPVTVTASGGACNFTNTNIVFNWGTGSNSSRPGPEVGSAYGDWGLDNSTLRNWSATVSVTNNGVTKNLVAQCSSASTNAPCYTQSGAQDIGGDSIALSFEVQSYIHAKVECNTPATPNLIASTITPTAATSGTAVALSSTVSNVGTASTGTTFTDVFQRATDASGAGATVIGTYSNPIRTAGTSGAATLSYTFPTAGTYYVRICADNNASFVGTIAESNELDNCGAWTAVTVTGANLTASTITPTSATSGTAVTLSSTISNVGSSSTGTTFTDVFQVATDAAGTGATVIGTPTNAIRAAGTSGAVTLSYTFATPGVKYVRVCADNNASFVGTINETNEADNCSGWTAVTVNGANLTAGPITPIVATAGVAVTLTSTVTNGGPVSTGTTFTDVFQTATDASGTGAIVIGTFANPTRPANSSGAATLSYAFPSGGLKYVRICADNNASFVGTINETSESDNCGTWTAVNVTGAVVTGPDLVASNPTPTTAVVGTSRNFSSTVTNAGIATTGTTFTNLFQFDNDTDHSTIAATDTDVSPILAAGAADVTIGNYTFPTSGSWYVRACADNDQYFTSDITEGNEGNNCSAWTTVTVSGPAGAGVTACSVTPSSIADGGSATWSATPNTLGTYTWTPSEGGVPGGSGPTLVRSYTGTNATFGMTVTAGGSSVNCPNLSVGSSPFGPADPTVVVSPPRVVPGGTATLTINATGVDVSCVVSGPGITTQTIPGVGGSIPTTVITTSALNNQSTYSVNCDNEGPVKTIVNLIPAVQEF